MRTVPENHPVSKMFRALTERAMNQAQLSDNQVILYVSQMLLHFLHTENLYPYMDESGNHIWHITDMMLVADQSDLKEKQEIYRYVGDYALFILGVFPESLERPRRNNNASFWASQGRRSYIAASELQQRTETTHLYRKMADQFERCILGLNWFKEYTSDPFYQYMLSEFSVGV
ncbi:MAG TPA: hypothetical protein VGQ81_11840 [Acidobacteriota bacterium]|nr:hypothetical protein [Acidobacteriota bacterium]